MCVNGIRGATRTKGRRNLTTLSEEDRFLLKEECSNSQFRLDIVGGSFLDKEGLVVPTGGGESLPTLSVWLACLARGISAASISLIYCISILNKRRAAREGSAATEVVAQYARTTTWVGSGRDGDSGSADAESQINVAQHYLRCPCSTSKYFRDDGAAQQTCQFPEGRL